MTCCYTVCIFVPTPVCCARRTLLILSRLNRPNRLLVFCQRCLFYGGSSGPEERRAVLHPQSPAKPGLPRRTGEARHQGAHAPRSQGEPAGTPVPSAKMLLTVVQYRYSRRGLSWQTAVPFLGQTTQVPSGLSPKTGLQSLIMEGLNPLWDRTNGWHFFVIGSTGRVILRPCSIHIYICIDCIICTPLWRAGFGEGS